MDTAEIAFQAWINIKTKGKQRFILKWFTDALVVELPLMLLFGKKAISTGVNISGLIITGLIVLGIWLIIVISIWYLNNKYQNDIHRLLKQQREMG